MCRRNSLKLRKTENESKSCEYISSLTGSIPEPGKKSWWGPFRGLGWGQFCGRRNKFFGNISFQIDEILKKWQIRAQNGIFLEFRWRWHSELSTQRYDTWSISPKRDFWPFLTQYTSRAELYSPEDLV
jgi:hypothetical protein